MERKRKRATSQRSKEPRGRRRTAKKDVPSLTAQLRAWVLWLKRKGKSNLSGDLLYDASRKLLPSSAGASFGNSVVSIDPYTGLLGTPIWVGSEPNKLALSNDGTTLWVSLNGTPSVRKVNLVSGTATAVQPYFPGASTFTLTVNGSNFVPTSTVSWSGTSLPTTFVNSSQLTAMVQAALVGSPGSADVTVSNRTPGEVCPDLCRSQFSKPWRWIQTTSSSIRLHASFTPAFPAPPPSYWQ